MKFRLYLSGIFLSLFFTFSLLESLAQSKSKTTQINTEGFFTLDQVDDHWWLISPQGKPFFSIGINHIDPASLRYPENIHIWEEKVQCQYHRMVREIRKT